MVWYGCGLSTLGNLLGLDGNGDLLSRKKSPDTAVVSEKDRQLSHRQEEYVSWNLLKKIVPVFFMILDLAQSKKLLHSYPVLRIAEAILGMLSFNLSLFIA